MMVIRSNCSSMDVSVGEGPKPKALVLILPAVTAMMVTMAVNIRRLR